jgi:hypothetical protein
MVGVKGSCASEKARRALKPIGRDIRVRLAPVPQTVASGDENMMENSFRVSCTHSSGCTVLMHGVNEEPRGFKSLISFRR